MRYMKNSLPPQGGWPPLASGQALVKCFSCDRPVGRGRGSSQNLLKWIGGVIMSDGREEREEREKRLEQELRESREDLLERDYADEWEPERGGS